jgi:hypothetical protein
MHSYPGPDSPAAEPHRASVLGEFGGLAATVDGHSLTSHFWGYVMLTNMNELADQYTRMLKRVWRSHNLRGLSAAVYTQTTDVETEGDGLLTYDRAVAKIDPAKLLAANNSGFTEVPRKVVLADALYDRMVWKYTIEMPETNWFMPKFYASGWKDGAGGFGTDGTPGIYVGTIWNTPDIWLRRDFNLASEDIPGMKLQVFHDEDVEVYVNGVLALKEPGFITDYDDFDISKEALAALHSGNNTIAVHCHQTTGGQGVDVGLLAPMPQNIKER